MIRFKNIKNLDKMYLSVSLHYLNKISYLLREIKLFNSINKKYINKILSNKIQIIISKKKNTTMIMEWKKKLNK